jgi:hypothetical protein
MAGYEGASPNPDNLGDFNLAQGSDIPQPDMSESWANPASLDNQSQMLMGDAKAVRDMGGNGDALLQSAAQSDAAQVADAEQLPATKPPDAREIAAQTQKPVSLLPKTETSDVQRPQPTQVMGPAAAPQATAPQATAAVQVQPAAATAQAAAPQRSFFDRLLFNKYGDVNPGALRLGGGILAGVGQGYAASQAAAQKQKQFDAQQAMLGQTPNFRLTR